MQITDEMVEVVAECIWQAEWKRAGNGGLRRVPWCEIGDKDQERYRFVAREVAAVTAALAHGEPVDSIESYYRRQIEWSRNTFGPGTRTAGVIDHIRKELKEIEAEPTDLSEWIDVVILAMDGFWRHGGSAEDLMPRLIAKQQKNFARKWPDWRSMSPDKAIEHDRTHDAHPAPQPSGPVQQEDEAYEIGKRVGYSDAVQQIDQLTGGDGEYRYCTDHDPDRHTPDPASMIRRIVDRFEALNTLEDISELNEWKRRAVTAEAALATHRAQQPSRPVEAHIQHTNGKRWCIESADGRWTIQPEGQITADEARALCGRILSALMTGEPVKDALPNGHTILEQSETLDGRVSQTVRVDTTGEEYERIVHADEAYGEDE